MVETARIKAEKEAYDKLSPEIKLQKEVERQEFLELYLKHVGSNPFQDVAIVPVGPAAVLPYKYIDGFWDYCSDSDEKVFLNLSNISDSFESRREFLTEKAILISAFAFFISFGLITGGLFFNYNKKIRSTK